MTDLVLEGLVSAALGLSEPQVLAIKLGATLLAEVLKHPRNTAGASAAPSVLSSTPGRVRIAAEGLRGSACLGRRIEERVAQLPGVEKVSASPVTGTVLVGYEPDEIGVADIGRAIRLAGLALRVVEPDSLYPVTSPGAVPA